MTAKSKKWLFAALATAVTLVAAAATLAYLILYYPNFNTEEGAGKKYIYIYDGDWDFGDLCQQISDSAGCCNISSFRMLASLRKYPENIKAGRYAIEPNMGNYELVKRLRSGSQAPVKLTFNNIRLLDDLADRIASQLMLTPADLLDRLTDPQLCESLGFTTQTIALMFIPNTYEVWWNISADNLIKRMKREYDAFWTLGRRKLATEIDLTPVEVSILASIVEEETSALDEYPVVAGLYINRMRRGMKLQADPTVKFAVGDFSLQRILNKHLEVDSPYNTYIYEGLPPGPVRIPSPASINAVLNPAQHKFLYMCAKEDFSGRHRFAVSLSDHNRNAEKYRKALNLNGIK